MRSVNIGMTLDSSKHIVLVADNDGRPWKDGKEFLRIIEDLKANNYRVDVVYPETPHKGQKIDFNDVLQSERDLRKIRDAAKAIIPNVVPHVTLLKGFQQRLQMREKLNTLNIKDH